MPPLDHQVKHQDVDILVMHPGQQTQPCPFSTTFVGLLLRFTGGLPQAEPELVAQATKDTSPEGSSTESKWGSQPGDGWLAGWALPDFYR